MKPLSSDTLLDEQTGEHPDESTLLDFSSGALGVAASDALIAHLDRCSRCRQVVSCLTRATSDELEPVVPDEIDPTRVGFDPLIGQVLGEYQVLERINQGGMGVLYRGVQPLTGRPVAIKVLRPEMAADPNLVHRLLGEARAVNSIRHPNIIDIFFLGQLADGRHYMVMELLEGVTLSDLLRDRGRLEPAEVVQVLEQALAALEAAHAAAVIHRDLKPENLFVDPRPEGWRITVLDFGLAKQQGARNRQLTAPNLVLGTPGYMAPEQIRGLEATTAVDIYSMGIVAWALLAGREPFTGRSMVEVMKRHLDDPVPPVRVEVPAVSVGLEGLVARMMAKDPAARPTAAEARKLLLRLKHDSRRFVQTVEVTEEISPQVVREGARAALSAGRLDGNAAGRPDGKAGAGRPDGKAGAGRPDGKAAGRPDGKPALSPGKPDGTPITEPEGVPPVPPAGRQPVAVVSDEPATLRAGERRPVRPDPSLLMTAPDRRPPGTAPEPWQVALASIPRAALIIAAIGLALIGGAVGLLSAGPLPQPPAPVPLIEPARPPASPVGEPVVVVDPPRPPVPSRAEVERRLASARAQVPRLSPGRSRRQLSLQLGRLETRLKKSEDPAVISRELELLLEKYPPR